MITKVSTVNVIETVDGVPNQLFAFTDNKAGNKSAESLFARVAMENGMPKTDAEAAIEDGYHENGTYTVYLIHST